jgi:hypothetical protein
MSSIDENEGQMYLSNLLKPPCGPLLQLVQHGCCLYLQQHPPAGVAGRAAQTLRAACRSEGKGGVFVRALVSQRGRAVSSIVAGTAGAPRQHGSA